MPRGIPNTATAGATAAPPPVSKAGAKVTVACKYPGGIVLRNYKMVDAFEPIFGGGTRQIKKAEQFGESITIKGPATPFGVSREDPIVGGYALTQNVDADFWNAWLAANADLPLVKNKLIFAFESDEAARGQAKELKGNLSGLEPLNMARTIKDGKDVPVDARVPAKIQRAETTTSAE